LTGVILHRPAKICRDILLLALARVILDDLHLQSPQCFCQVHISSQSTWFFDLGRIGYIGATVEDGEAESGDSNVQRTGYVLTAIVHHLYLLMWRHRDKFLHLHVRQAKAVVRSTSCKDI
jgi:hypothetical protein